ncbi:MAG: DUF4332 domain-containing protein [Cyanobacteriota bacterium]|nr:DUF4332 domain-containing protein [Cyanobacteriota bacterium]
MSVTRPKKRSTKRPTKSDRPHSKDWPIEQLPGLSREDTQKLIACGIPTTMELLRQIDRPARQEALAVRLRVRVTQVKKWVALADLARLPNVGLQYCGLLLHCGVGSVDRLAELSVGQLHPQIRRFQVATLQRKDLCRELCPGPEEVTLWIQQARQFARTRRS